MAQGDREIVTLRAENADGGRSEPSPGNHNEDATKSVVRLSCFEEDVKVLSMFVRCAVWTILFMSIVYGTFFNML